MNCKNCNSPLEDGTLFCPNCGQKVEEINETPFAEEQVNIVENPTSEPVVESTPVPETPVQPVINEPSAPVQPVMSEPTPVVQNKKSNGGLIALFIVLGVILLGAIVFGAIKLIPLFGNKNTPTIPTKVEEKETKKEEKISYKGYTFTVPSEYEVKTINGYYQFGNSKFKVLIANIDTYNSYSQYANSADSFADDFKKYITDTNSNTKYLSSAEETYNGKKFLIFSFDISGSKGDVVLTELLDKEVLMLVVKYDDVNDKKEGYNNLAKFVSSAVNENKTDTTTDTTTTDTTSTSKDYMEMGNETLGYLKLPGTWTKGKIAGSSDSSLQYFTYDGGKYIATLDVLDKTKYTDIKATAAVFEASYKSDSDATNISTTQTKVGKYDAYQIKVQYKSDSVWVYSYFFKAEDGLIHMIQTEGLDTTSKNFNVQDTFTLIKTN